MNLVRGGFLAMFQQHRRHARVPLQDADQLRPTIPPMSDDSGEQAHGYLFIYMNKYNTA